MRGGEKHVFIHTVVAALVVVVAVVVYVIFIFI